MRHHDDALHRIKTELPEDFKPYGMTERRGKPDCSNGCVHFFKLMPRDGEQLGNNWGVCGHSESHRKGLLTFEHQGCDKFEGTKASRYHKHINRVTLP